MGDLVLTCLSAINGLEQEFERASAKSRMVHSRVIHIEVFGCADPSLVVTAGRSSALPELWKENKKRAR